MKVSKAMHKGALCVNAAQSVTSVAKKMRDADVGALPVRENGTLVGIVTDRDLACRALVVGGDAHKLTARDVMTADILTCGPNDDVSKVAKKMEKRQIRRMPVVDKRSKMIGMLSLGDICHSSGKKLTAEVLSAVSAHHK